MAFIRLEIKLRVHVHGKTRASKIQNPSSALENIFVEYLDGMTTDV